MTDTTTFGASVADARRLLEGAETIYLAVRVSDVDVTYVEWTVAAATKWLRQNKHREERLPCEFDPADKSLTIGSLAAIHAAAELKS